VATHSGAVALIHQNIDETYARLSMSLEENVFKVCSLFVLTSSEKLLINNK
jgi:hypothetical protein